jgi:hypothetical protein
VRGQQERSSIEYKHFQAASRSKPEDFLRAVAAEHTRSNNDRVELPGTAGCRFIPGVTHVTAEGVQRQRCALDVRRRHDRLAGIY